MSSPAAGPPQVLSRDRIGPAEAKRIRELIAVATTTDGVRPLNEAAMLELEAGSYLLTPADRPDVSSPGAAPEHDPLAGFVRLVDGVHTASADLVVHPDHRRRGIGSALLGAALRTTAGRELRVWAHGPHPGAAPLAAAYGMRPVRELWRMRRHLLGPDAPELPEPSLPPESVDVRIRTFRPGQDEDAWLQANATAFADHPEQGGLTWSDLQERMAQPWFSPEGFFVAERDGRIIGFHWTKVHPAEGDQSPVGEIYVLGVAEPAAGLGSALALTGLRHLAGLGIAEAMLFTESDNERAIGLYRKFGFVHTNSDVMYAGSNASPASDGPASAGRHA